MEGGGRWARRPTGAASEGSANRRAVSDWKMLCASLWQAASVPPPAKAAGSRELTSLAVRLPRSKARGPSCDSLRGRTAGEGWPAAVAAGSSVAAATGGSAAAAEAV